ncbi:hypothetical protein NPIL_455721 [Nephila pilipes]|uniref:Uncharacterized protein n=1 Tax=Nephila pilipes TaxID=299642 RepID=A0A8X6TJW2_NEPPI|nr:hypothetical protein NPIL_455721 [Nephila pilipes]
MSGRPISGLPLAESSAVALSAGAVITLVINTTVNTEAPAVSTSPDYYHHLRRLAVRSGHWTHHRQSSTRHEILSSYHQRQYRIITSSPYRSSSYRHTSPTSIPMVIRLSSSFDTDASSVSRQYHGPSSSSSQYYQDTNNRQ